MHFLQCQKLNAAALELALDILSLLVIRSVDIRILGMWPCALPDTKCMKLNDSGFEPTWIREHIVVGTQVRMRWCGQGCEYLRGVEESTKDGRGRGEEEGRRREEKRAKK